jgi:predicted acyltransferase (DUF342 family)
MIDVGIALRIAAIAIFALAGAVLPLSAAIREARKPRDREPLDVDRRYRKDDRFFAKAFDDLLTGALGPPPRPAGVHAAHLHQDESVEVVAGSITLLRDDVQKRIYDIGGDLQIQGGSTVPKEILVGGSAEIGDGVRLRALKAHGRITLGRSVDVERWIDADWRLTAARESHLGVRATSLEEIVLGPTVKFGLLSAPRIVVEDGDRRYVASSRPATTPTQSVIDFAERGRFRLRADGALLVDDDFVMPEGSVATGDVIARGDVHIGKGSLLRGSIHSDARVTIGDGADIEGSVYGERELRVGIGAVISDHAITAGPATVSASARIGTPGRVTTLLADGSIELGPGATVCGRVVAGQGGITRGESIS